MRRTETPKPIWIKFCTVVDIPDVVKYANFCDHRLRGFWVAVVKFSPLPLTFIVALTTLSHYRASVWSYRLLQFREITWSIKGNLNVLLQSFSTTSIYRTCSKVEHIVEFTAIFSNICTAHAQKRLFMNFRCKFRHRRSIRRPRFPVRVQNFGDFATFSVDFCILYAEYPPYYYFRFLWPTDLESIPHASTPT